MVADDDNDQQRMIAAPKRGVCQKSLTVDDEE
jgi:hypothetical protein